MATDLDKLVVKIEADLSGLKKGMAQANKSIKNSSGKFKKSLNKINNSFLKLGRTVVKFGAVAAVAFGAVAIRSIIKSGVAVEELALRFNLFFGSIEEGQKAFQVLLKFAEKVPFSLGEIQRGAAPLLAVSKNSKELSRNLEIVGNLAAATGLDFALAALQYQKVASAGIGAADLLRDTGVKAQLGFVEGMAYTAEESVRIFQRDFSKGGRFAKATDDMAGTLRGVFSQVTDSLEKFQQAIASTFIPTLTENFGDLVTTLRENSDEIKKIGEEIGRKIAEALTFLIENKVAIVNALKLMGYAALAAAANFLTFGLAVKFAGAGIMWIKNLPKWLISLIVGSTVLKSDTVQDEGFFAQFKEITKLIKEQKEAFGDGLTIEIDASKVEELKATIQLIKDFKEGIVDSFDAAGTAISNTIGQAIVSGESFRQSMLDIFQNIVSQVISLIIQLTIVDKILKEVKASIEGSKSTSFGGVLADATAGFFAGLGNVILGANLNSGSSLTGSSFAGETTGSMVYGGGMAGGGSVNANMPYMVGERGAEMFVPKSAGNIINNSQLGSGGGGNIVIEQNLNFATGVSQTVRAEILNLLPAIQESTLGAVRDARLRGGTFAKDFGG